MDQVPTDNQKVGLNRAVFPGGAAGPVHKRVVSQKQKRDKVRGPTPASLTSYGHALFVQMATFFARDHLAECSLVLPLCLELPKLRGDDGRTGRGSGSTMKPHPRQGLEEI